MKPNITNSTIPALSITIGAFGLLALVNLTPLPASAATITYVGSTGDAPEVPAWRTASVPKTFDIDGDNIYGTMGAVHWRVIGTGQTTAGATTLGWAYISEVSYGQYKNPGYPMIDNLADPATQTEAGIAAVQSPGSFTFELTGTAADYQNKFVRVGIMADVLTAAEAVGDSNKTFQIVQTVGGTGSSDVVSLRDGAAGNNQPEMYFFDIKGIQPGDRFQVITGAGGKAGYVGPMSWDIANLTELAITLTSPLNGQVSFEGASISAAASIVNGTTPYTVTFYINFAGGEYAEAGVVTEEPYSLDLGALAPGTYSVYATVADSAPTTTAISETNTFVVAVPAVIDYIGIDTTTGPNWMGVYGASGYELLALHRDSPTGNTGTYQTWNGTDGNVTSLPSFIASIVVPPTSVWSGNGNFGQMQDPTQAGALVNTPAVLPLRGGGSITINRANSEPFDMTIFVGISSDGGFANNSSTFTLSDGSGLASGDTSVLPVGGQPGTPGMAYLKFSVGAGTAPLTLSFNADPINLAGLAFDTAAEVAPTITKDPIGGTLLEGAEFQLSVTASGTKPLSYLWYKGTELVPDATTNVLNFPSLAASDAGTYTVVVTNAQGAVTSSPAVVVVETELPEKIVQYEAAVRDELFLFSSYPFDYWNANDAIGMNNGTLIGNTQFGPGPAGGANQALVLNGSGHVALGTVPDFTFPSGAGTIEAWVRADWTSIGYNPCLFANREGGSVRYSIHMMAGKNQLVYWNGTAGSAIDIPPAGNTWHLLAISFDTASWTLYWDGVAVMTADEAFGTGVDLPTQIGSATSASTSEGWVGALDEVSFFSDILSAEQVQAHYNAFAVGDPPSLQTQPQGGLFFVGTPFTMSVLATGPELVYQWYKNGAAITDATSSTLEFAVLASGDSGDYQVVVTNSVAAVTSIVAQVDVRVPDSAQYQIVVKAEPSLVSFYPFDDGTANDAVSVNNGTLNGTIDFAPGLGGTGDQALITSGGGYVTLGTVPDFAFESGVGTAEAWVRADWEPGTLPPSTNPCIFANRGAGVNTDTRWSIHMMQNKTQIAFWNGANVWMAAIPPAGNSWHLLASVFDNGTWRLYWDGQIVTNASAPLGNNQGFPTQLGSATPDSVFEGWVGGIDQVAFYGAALTDAQALNHYNAMIDPALHYSRSGNSLTISWNEALEGFTLESTSVLPAVSWDPVDGVVNNSVTVDTSIEGPKFYRLRR